MKASELITHLQAIIDEHGDLEVHEGDYGMPIVMPCYAEEFPQMRGEGSPKLLKDVVII